MMTDGSSRRVKSGSTKARRTVPDWSIRKVRAHLLVRTTYRLINGEDESKLARHLVVHIAQERKGQFQLFGKSSAVVRRLRRNRHECSSPCLQLRQCLMIGAQRQMAIRTPGTTIEGQDDWPLLEQM